jgi:hypothetical protein
LRQAALASKWFEPILYQQESALANQAKREAVIKHHKEEATEGPTPKTQENTIEEPVDDGNGLCKR